MVTKFSEYIAYFEAIAATHVDIGHTAGESHFFLMDLEEVIRGLKNKVNFPALILEDYTFGFSDNKSDNVLKKRSTAFMIVDRVADQGNSTSIKAVLDHMEEIGDEIIIKMLHDKRELATKVVRDFQIEEVHAVPIYHDIDHFYGFRYEFSISSSRTNSIDPDKWTE